MPGRGGCTIVTTGWSQSRAKARSSASRTSHGPGQPVAVPGDGAAMIGDDRRLAVTGDDAAFDRLEIKRQELQAVRRVAHQVAFDKYLGDRRARAAGNAACAEHAAQTDQVGWR